MEKFEGLCVDGPLAGKKQVHERREFMTLEQERISIGSYLNQMDPFAPVNIRQVLYRHEKIHSSGFAVWVSGYDSRHDMFGVIAYILGCLEKGFVRYNSIPLDAKEYIDRRIDKAES